MHKRSLMLVVLAVLFISGCKPTPTAINTPQATDSTLAYPNPPTGDTDGLAYPGSEYSQPAESDNSVQLPENLDIPEPIEGTAVIYGQLKANDGASYAYLAGDIFLAPVIYSQGDVQIPFFSLDPTSDPKADQRTKNHQFLFSEVPPGSYGLIIHTPVSDFVVPDGAGDLLYVEVKPGDVIDLGVITIE